LLAFDKWLSLIEGAAADQCVESGIASFHSLGPVVSCVSESLQKEHDVSKPAACQHPNSKGSLLEETLAAARRDQQMVTPEGEAVRAVIEGVRIRPLPLHIDQRGSVCELYDLRWAWHDEPLVFAYCFTIRPGVVKGWNLHQEHEDRYALIQGEMELVLYDPRPDSATCGDLCRLVLSGSQRCLVNVPRNVWHADHNIGTTDVLVVNFPTTPYDHARPDKYRLPLDTNLIPYSFGNAVGG
jgi:dTDP-4-dehydrorhamnose 3,5-epimerase